MTQRSQQLIAEGTIEITRVHALKKGDVFFRFGNWSEVKRIENNILYYRTTSDGLLCQVGANSKEFIQIVTKK